MFGLMSRCTEPPRLQTPALPSGPTAPILGQAPTPPQHDSEQYYHSPAHHSLDLGVVQAVGKGPGGRPEVGVGALRADEAKVRDLGGRGQLRGALDIVQIHAPELLGGAGGLARGAQRAKHAVGAAHRLCRLLLHVVHVDDLLLQLARRVLGVGLGHGGLPAADRHHLLPRRAGEQLAQHLGAWMSEGGSIGSFYGLGLFD